MRDESCALDIAEIIMAISLAIFSMAALICGNLVLSMINKVFENGLLFTVGGFDINFVCLLNPIIWCVVVPLLYLVYCIWKDGCPSLYNFMGLMFTEVAILFIIGLLLISYGDATGKLPESGSIMDKNIEETKVLRELPKVDIPNEFIDVSIDTVDVPVYYKDETNDSEFQMYTVKEIPSEIKKQVGKADKRYIKKKVLKYYYFKKPERYIVFIYEKDGIKIIEATGSSYKPYVFKFIQDTVKAKS